ncbi:MAG: site-specific DNA-methyltransferase [Oscillospiraceae bacterium]|nr:site-specific DNA-methyltransferase [Oscillospiraceae bacterium]
MADIIDFNYDFKLETALNHIIHGDCLQVMKAMPDKCIDVIITSPPYNLLNSTGNGLKKKYELRQMEKCSNQRRLSSI